MCPRAGRLESRFGIQALKHINNGEKPVTLGAAGRVDLEEDCGERKIECHPGPYPQGRVRDAGRRADSHNPRREGHVRDDARARACPGLPAVPGVGSDLQTQTSKSKKFPTR